MNHRFFVIVVMFCLTIWMVAPARAQEDAGKPEQSAVDMKWFACQGDDDCVRDTQECGGIVSVNKNYLEQYRDANKKNQPGYECPPFPAQAASVFNSMQAKCSKNVCITAIPGAASGNDIKPEWFACQRDEDCLYDAGACGGAISLNSKFRDAYHNAIRQSLPDEKCAPLPKPLVLSPGASSKQAKAVCKEEMCETVISASAPDSNEPDGRWLACESDDDCVKINSVCDVMVGMSKKYADRFDRLMNTVRSKTTVACYFVPSKNRDYTASTPVHCFHNVCALSD